MMAIIKSYANLIYVYVIYFQEIKIFLFNFIHSRTKYINYLFIVYKIIFFVKIFFSFFIVLYTAAKVRDTGCCYLKLN